MRGKGLILVALGAAALNVSAALGQSKPQFKILDATRYDFAVGYNNVRANAPPSDCQCFNTNGGFLFGSFHLTEWLSLEGEFTGSHSSNISPLGQALTLMTFTGGPRVSHRFHRWTPYGEVLVGAAYGTDSYFPSKNSSSSSASSFAVSTGGGVDFRLTPRFSFRALNMQYLRTSLPNGVNNEQNQLMIGGGLLIKFQGHDRETDSMPAPAQAEVPPPPPPPPPVVAFTCSTNVANVPQGEMVAITGDARTEPGRLDVDYSWSTDGGAVEGSGKTVSINTTGMATGDYRVKGRASLVSSPSIGGDCVAVFRVIPVVAPPAGNTYVNIEEIEKEFHENVKDAYFDVNSAKIKPDTLATIIHAAQYLVAHPSMKVLITGWADSRGSADYNLILGSKRANAVRDALIEAGVPPSQLEVISNGKSSQVCTSRDRQCWQENRRVSYTMKP